MPRQRCCSRQGSTYYVYQCGRSRNLSFFDAPCFDFFLTRLCFGLQAYRIRLHSYVLLPTEIQLLITPYSISGVARLLGSVASDYGDYFQDRFGRQCSLASYSPRLAVLEGGRLVLDCQKFIELAPVREGLVEHPGEYAWSAYRINAFGGHGTGLSMHQQYRQFFASNARPFPAYRDFIATPFSDSQLAFMEHRVRLTYPVRVWNRTRSSLNAA